MDDFLINLELNLKNILFLDVRLKKISQENQLLKNEIQQLHQQIIDLRTQRRSGSVNGPLGDDDLEDAQS